MNTVIFKRLKISNWRAQNIDIVFDSDTIIEGHNGSGKSTIWDAILWVFTGYDTFDRNNYLLFDETTEKTFENSHPAVVEMTLLLNDTEYCLKKTAAIGWVRPQGSSEYNRKGSDSYTFEIDGVEVSPGDYKTFIENNFAQTDILKYILNINYFLTLSDWRVLRKSLMDVIGEISDDELVGDFKDILTEEKLLGGLEQVLARLRAKKKMYIEDIGGDDRKGKKVIEKETLYSTLPDIDKISEAKKEKEILSVRLTDIDNQILGISDSTKDIMEKRKNEMSKISEAEYAYENDKNSYVMEQTKKEKELQNEIMEVENCNAKIKKENVEKELQFNMGKKMYETLHNELQELREKREELLLKNAEIKGLQFTADKCAYCGQPLPEDLLEAQRKSFLENREQEHQEIVAKGKKVAERIILKEKELQETAEKINKEIEYKDYISASDLKTKLEDLKSSFIPFDSTDIGQEMLQKIDDLRATLTPLPKIDELTEELVKEKSELLRRIEVLMETAGKEKNYISLKERIKGLEEDIKNTALAMAENEKQINKVREIERQRGNILKQRIECYFKICSIEIEEEKKDGEKRPACNIMVDGVDVNVTNTADKIRAGIDISSAFCKKYGILMPLIIDNAERVDSDILQQFTPYKTSRQLIIMRRKDCELTVC